MGPEGKESSQALFARSRAAISTELLKDEVDRGSNAETLTVLTESSLIFLYKCFSICCMPLRTVTVFTDFELFFVCLFF